MSLPHWWLWITRTNNSVGLCLINRSFTCFWQQVNGLSREKQSLISNQNNCRSLSLSWAAVSYRKIHIVSTNLQHEQHRRWLRPKLIKYTDNHFWDSLILYKKRLPHRTQGTVNEGVWQVLTYFHLCVFILVCGFLIDFSHFQCLF